MELGLSVEMEISERAFTICYYGGPGGLWWTNVLNLALPPQRLRPDKWLEHQDCVSRLAFGKSEVFCQCSVGVLYELFHMQMYF